MEKNTNFVKEESINQRIGTTLTMKKFLSFALVAMMVVLAALSVSAVEWVAGDGYNVYTGTYYDQSESVGLSEVKLITTAVSLQLKRLVLTVLKLLLTLKKFLHLLMTVGSVFFFLKNPEYSIQLIWLPMLVGTP